MKLVNLIVMFLVSSSFFSLAIADGHGSKLMHALENDTRFSSFVDVVGQSGMERILSEESAFSRTIYVPTDAAFNNLPAQIKNSVGEKAIARKLVRTHYFIGTHEKLAEGQQVKRVNVEGDVIQIYQAKDLYVKDMIVKNREIVVGNSTIVPIDCVMFLQPSDTDYRLSADTKSQYPLTTCCLRTEAEVTAFMDDL